jgi:hypothetical protein
MLNSNSLLRSLEVLTRCGLAVTDRVRVPGRRGAPYCEGGRTMAATARIALFTLSVGLVGCATQPAMSWFRADGKAVVPIQFEADETNCRDEVQKARLAGPNQLGILSRLQAHNDVFVGCMADKGYVQRPVSRI